MNYLFLAYRSWALKIIERLKKRFKGKKFLIIKNKTQFKKKIIKFNSKNTIIILIGWSELLKKNVVNNYQCYGIHPSDLPSFRGGSPLQNQILRNIKNSKISLFKLNDKIDDGQVYLKEKLSLAGDDMTKVFKNLENSGFNLLVKFFRNRLNLIPLNINLKTSFYRRRKREESKLTIKEIEKKGLIYIYNKIRSLTNPYPNAYLEDKKGNKLYFEKVKFKKK